MAGFPRAAGVPDHTKTGSAFIPEFFSTKTQIKYYENCVALDICNTDFTEDIKSQGDRVTIRTIPTTTISAFSAGQSLKTQQATSTPIVFYVDKAQSFTLGFDDVIEFQSDLPMVDIQTADAGKKMAEAIDADILQNTYSSADADNYGSTAGLISNTYDLGSAGAPLVFSESNATKTLTTCGVVLYEQNVPGDNRWIVLPAWALGVLQNSDLKNASLTGEAKSPLLTGKISDNIAGFKVYWSNQLATASDASGVTAWYCPFGHRDAISFASQIIKTETVRNGDTFGDIVRGLEVYGYKVTKDTALGYLYITLA